MKVAAARAIAALAHKPVPDDVKKAYHEPHLEFGRSYILPKPYDRRLLTSVAPAIIKAAVNSGVARRSPDDYEEYTRSLEQIIVNNDAMIRYLIEAQASADQHAQPLAKF